MSDIYDHFPQIISEANAPVTVLEIGVGRAEDTGRMVDYIIGTGKPYRFIAFEPEIGNIPIIADKVANKVVVANAAVGDRDGEVDFIGSGPWPLSGSVKEPKEHKKSYPWIQWQKPVKVPMVKLDTVALLHGINKVDFIWCDVQGAEDLVLAGGQKILAATRWLYTEFYSTEEYAGQIPLAEIERRLPGKWMAKQVWAGDIAGSGNVLFKNLDFAP